MAKYIIHSCDKRQWYVDKYIVPSMIGQGIANTDIMIYQDEAHEGNLRSFIESGRQLVNMLGESVGVWHLQDDVLISRDFKEQTEKHDRDIVCGFTCCYDDNKPYGETIASENMWWSFPCIRIPNYIIKGFVEWTDVYLWHDPQFERQVKQKKEDDYVFKAYVTSYHKNCLVLNLAPNIVEHVDYLIGGSVVNVARGSRDVRSLYWADEELVEDLKRRLKDDIH